MAKLGSLTIAHMPGYLSCWVKGFLQNSDYFSFQNRLLKLLVCSPDMPQPASLHPVWLCSPLGEDSVEMDRACGREKSRSGLMRCLVKPNYVSVAVPARGGVLEQAMEGWTDISTRYIQINHTTSAPFHTHLKKYLLGHITTRGRKWTQTLHSTGLTRRIITGQTSIATQKAMSPTWTSTFISLPWQLSSSSRTS